jgi:hypothetical protein
MSPGWLNVRNSLAANGHRRPRTLGHNALIIFGLGAALWTIVVVLAWII